MQGIKVENVYLRMDSKGKLHVIFRTVSGKLAVASVEDITVGMPDQVKKDDMDEEERRRKRQEEIETQKKIDMEFKDLLRKEDAKLRQKQAALLQKEQDNLMQKAIKKIRGK